MTPVKSAKSITHNGNFDHIKTTKFRAKKIPVSRTGLTDSFCFKLYSLGASVSAVFWQCCCAIFAINKMRVSYRIDPPTIDLYMTLSFNEGKGTRVPLLYGLFVLSGHFFKRGHELLFTDTRRDD